MDAVMRVDHENPASINLTSRMVTPRPPEERNSKPNPNHEKMNGAVPEEELRTEELVNQFNKEMEQWGKQLRFRYNEEANQTYVEVVDLATQEVVVSLPPEYLIDLSIKLKEMIGLFMDKKL